MYHFFMANHSASRAQFSTQRLLATQYLLRQLLYCEIRPWSCPLVTLRSIKHLKLILLFWDSLKHPRETLTLLHTESGLQLLSHVSPHPQSWGYRYKPPTKPSWKFVPLFNVIIKLSSLHFVGGVQFPGASRMSTRIWVYVSAVLLLLACPLGHAWL